MCHAHRFVVGLTVLAWVVVLDLIFVVQPEPYTPWRMLTFGLLGLAVVLVPYSLYPWLLRGMMREEMKDMAGVFIAGWEAAKAPEPVEPATVTPIRLIS